MGEKPDKSYSLDRKNSKGNYEPNNCKWSTRKQQNRNKADNRRVVYKGEEKCVSEWCDILNLYYPTIRSRILKGMLPEKAFETKIKGDNIIINTQTGIYYNNLKEASIAYNIKYSTLSSYLNKYIKHNKTPLKFC